MATRTRESASAPGFELDRWRDVEAAQVSLEAARRTLEDACRDARDATARVDVASVAYRRAAQWLLEQQGALRAARRRVRL